MLPAWGYQSHQMMAHSAAGQQASGYQMQVLVLVPLPRQMKAAGVETHQRRSSLKLAQTHQKLAAYCQTLVQAQMIQMKA